MGLKDTLLAGDGSRDSNVVIPIMDNVGGPPSISPITNHAQCNQQVRMFHRDSCSTFLCFKPLLHAHQNSQTTFSEKGNTEAT
jgi:hypothetical protein